MGKNDVNLIEIKIPKSYNQALNLLEAFEWVNAMDQEVMNDRKVWVLVDPPKYIKILDDRWVCISYSTMDKMK